MYGFFHKVDDNSPTTHHWVRKQRTDNSFKGFPPETISNRFLSDLITNHKVLQNHDLQRSLVFNISLVIGTNLFIGAQ